MGEDRIGVSLAKAWRTQHPQDQQEALVLVGSGQFYLQASIPLLNSGFEPPSAGFAYLDPILLWRDIQAGLIPHLWRSWQCLKEKPADCMIAVGDIVVVIYAYFSGLPFAFIGSALSDHYVYGRHSSYDRLQRWLLRKACLGIFPRDALTTANLRKLGLPALWCGNPILDDLEPSADWFYRPEPGRIPLALVPGSRQDALENFSDWLQALAEGSEEPWDLLCPLAPGLEHDRFMTILQKQGWQEGPPWMHGHNRLWLCQASDWGNILHRVHLVLGMAGTAHEQAVGMGIPVLAFPGRGVQYTWSFAEAQTRLLGPALTLLPNGHPTLVRWQIRRMLANPHYRHMARCVSAERYGPKGAADRIVQAISLRLLD